MASVDRDELQIGDYIEEDHEADGSQTDPFGDGISQLPTPRSSSIADRRSRKWVLEDERPPSPSSDRFFPGDSHPAQEGSARQRDSDRGTQRLVIAIDYGTTYTGVAWSTSTNKVDILQHWTSTMNNHDKVRSMYSYLPGGKARWGSDTNGRAIAMVNTKLELETRGTRLDELEATLNFFRNTKHLSFANVRAAGPEPPFPAKSPQEIITDYLTRIRECVCNENNIDVRRLSTTNTPVDIVITVPVDWSYQAKNATFRAFRDAGFNRTIFPTLQDTLLVSEPEAASHFTARHFQDRSVDFLDVNQCYILCDAGGGTVDLVAYQVKRSDSLLELEEATTPSSGRCGSVFIDLAFKYWLRKQIRPENYKRLDPAHAEGRIFPGMFVTPLVGLTDADGFAAESGRMRELLNSFEARKRSFTHETGNVKLDLPEPLHKLNIEGRVREGELTITNDEMANLFAPSVDKVIHLIDKQIDQVGRKKNCRVKSIFLVGGFGASPHLQNQLRESLEIRNMTLRCPDPSTSWTATVRGAAIYGVEKNRHSKVECLSAITRSFAIVTGSEEKFEWLIRKGDLVLRNGTRTNDSQPFWIRPGHDNKFELPFYVYLSKKDDDVPELWLNGQNEVKAVLHVKCVGRTYHPRGGQQTRHTPYPDSSVRYRQPLGPLVCRIHLSGTQLKVQVVLDNDVLGQGEMTVETDQPQSYSPYADEDDEET